MPAISLPSIDNEACTSWTELDRERYNRLDEYFQLGQAKTLKTWSVWPKLLGSRNWEQNMGDLGKIIQKEYSPNLRSLAFPAPLSANAKKDLIAVRERSTPFSLTHQKFESPVFNFLPNFRDFMKNHIDFTLEDINMKIARFGDVFARAHIFHQSRNLIVSGGPVDGVLLAPQGDGNSAGTSGKTNAFLAATIAGTANMQPLSLNTLNLACSHLDDQRMQPFSGSELPNGDSSGLDTKYCLVLGSDAYNQFVYDPWLLTNKQIDLNVITNGFKGDLFGRIACKLEDMPLRIAYDATLLPGNPLAYSFPAPETQELNPAAENYGETLPNPAYLNAQFEIAFLVSGGKPYDMVKVGAPPKNFSSMPWNGKVTMTDNINVPCNDENGNVTVDTNKYKEYLQLISRTVLGIVGTQKRGIVPILFRRFRGARNMVAA